MSESVRVYYDADTDKSRLSGRTFAVVAISLSITPA